MEIKQLFTQKITKSINRPIKYIVIHYTAGTTSATGAARNTANYFKTSSVEASADFCVDDTEIYQCNSDLKNQYTWAVGGNKYSSMSTSFGGKYYGVCTNKNSISIEICSNKTNKKSLSANDTDWFFTKLELELAAKLTKYLMDSYNIPLTNVIMHHQVTGKICPQPFCLNESYLYRWNDFKKMINPTTTQTQKTETTTNKLNTSDITINVDGKTIKMNRILINDENYIRLRGFENLGWKIGYDKNTKLVTVNTKGE